jgi:hypothetical protein
MRITWFSEWSANVESVPRDFKNMRTEYAWYVAQGASHYSIASLKQGSVPKCDLGIIIIPKNVAALKPTEWDIVAQLKDTCKKYAFMQEGPSWYFQELNLMETFWFYNVMINADFFLAHNEIDYKYYEGLLGKRGYINPTLMITDLVENLPEVERDNVIVGGNIGNFYGGFNSMIVGLEVADKVYAPKMGRMKPEEKSVNEIQHLPYLEWYDWIVKLNEFKYAVHLNPNNIAGTFSLNCAFLGMPCIGSMYTNTQRMCFPDLSVHPTDVGKAKNLIRLLRDDKKFYNNVSKKAKYIFNEFFSEKKYIEIWNSILTKEFN